MKRCDTCGRLFRPAKAYHFRCLECWKRVREQETRFDSWREGYEAGLAERSANSIDDALLLDLLRLCHPDRHPAERCQLATRVTARLNALRDEVRS